MVTGVTEQPASPGGSRHTPAGQPLRFKADWGGANLTRVCGWLANWVWSQTKDHRLSVIHTGRGMADNLRALARGDVDVAVITPACFARLALTGREPFTDDPMPELRAIGLLPHRDAMLVAARADVGVAALADLAACQPPLRLSVGASDADGFMGLGARMVLGSAGVTLADIEARGGQIRYHEEPFGCLDDLRDGRADVIVTEAIMTQNWVRLAERIRLRFIGLADAQLRRLREEWDMRGITIPARYLPGLSEEVTTLDYSGWLIVTTSALPDQVASLLARAITENAGPLEMQYRHLPADRSPLAYPITVEHAAAAPIPLHPAADQVYRSALRS